MASELSATLQLLASFLSP